MLQTPSISFQKGKQ